MHESVRSDAITPPETESQLYDDEGESGKETIESPHPWQQLQTITPFNQIKPSPLKERSLSHDNISRSSGSSKSSCSKSDKSNDITSLEDISSNSDQPQKNLSYRNEHHSDPSHNRPQQRRGSRSHDSGSGFDESSHSVKRKLSSIENGSERRQRQYSASIDERVSYPSNKSDQYKVAVNGSKAVRTVSNRLSSSLLIESLIHQMCKMMIPDPKNQQAMYKIICNKLYEMHMIDETYAVDELQIIRNHYQKALYQMFSMGRSVTQANHQKEFLLPVPSVKIDRPLGQSVMEVSRYRAEFEELEFIDKGGFGRVYRVRHRLDGAFYAVKKIPFRNNEHVTQSVREVQILANFNHPNVVSYKAAWIEPIEFNDIESISSNSTRTTVTGTDTHNSSSCFKMDAAAAQHYDSPESDDIVFAESTGDGRKLAAGDSVKGNSRPRIKIERVHEKIKTRSTTTVSFESGGSVKSNVVESKNIISSSVHKAVQHYRSSTVSKEIRGKLVGFAILYVQMQLCELTLRQWLDERNLSSNLDIVPLIPTGLNLFQQIVSGVEYIHKRKIVHHDIKPSNIFMSNDLSVVQVGDFGLSCRFEPLWRHGRDIGTPQYSAPEQRLGDCDPKSDIFSLGIILVEILVPFKTAMERATVIRHLHSGEIPTELEIAAPAIAALVKRLTHAKPAQRPSATELLKELQTVQQLKCGGQCLNDQKKIINEISAQYKAVIEQKDREILELRKRIQELEEIRKKGDEE